MTASPVKRRFFLPAMLCWAAALTATRPARPEVTTTRLPLGTAPRAWCAVRGNTVYFTEKSPPPAGYHPGCVYRTLHAVAADGRGSRQLFVIGHTGANPLPDFARGIIYTLRRTRDTNGNGLVDPADRAELWRVHTGDGRAERLPGSLPPLAVSARTGELVVGNGLTLQLLRTGSSRPERLPSLPDGVRQVRFDSRGRLLATSGTGRHYRLEGGTFRPVTELDLLADGTRIRLVDGVPALILPGSPARPFPLQAGTVRFTCLWRLAGLVLLLRCAPELSLIAADPAAGRWTPLYAFPANTTFHATDIEGRQIALLTTWDSDGDGTLDPAGLDRSALSLIRIR